MAGTFKITSFLASLKGKKDHFKGKNGEMMISVLTNRNTGVFVIHSIAGKVIATQY